MPAWLETTLIVLAIALAVFYIGRMTYKQFKGRCSGCGFGGKQAEGGDKSRPVELTIDRKSVD